MAKIRIGEASIDNLCSKREKDALYWDETLKGFGVKITPSGTKIYVLQYRAGGSETPTRRFTIGRHGSPWTPAGARAEAERLLLRIANGDDPASAKAQQRDDAEHLGFAPYADRYLNSKRPRWAAGTWQSAESNIRRYAVPVLGRKPITAITRRDITAVLDGLPLDSSALPRNMFVRLCALFAWALERGDIERSPARHLVREKRQRTITAQVGSSFDPQKKGRSRGGGSPGTARPAQRGQAIVAPLASVHVAVRATPFWS
ncbi:MAG: hypothetical protein C0465_25690 [Ralstonia sp.]|uniref:tyrosine-type recombinase/integrase n=1 Tax=Pseudomonadota TaxID=1224 RepID=UPI0017DB5797|nr:hypothetical protein [Ralstonia sp.]MBA4773506.1 integrase arm-type DNA-binding domain-containing protein [Sphingomonas sp.]